MDLYGVLCCWIMWGSNQTYLFIKDSFSFFIFLATPPFFQVGVEHQIAPYLCFIHHYVCHSNIFKEYHNNCFSETYLCLDHIYVHIYTALASWIPCLSEDRISACWATLSLDSFETAIWKLPAVLYPQVTKVKVPWRIPCTRAQPPLVVGTMLLWQTQRPDTRAEPLWLSTTCFSCVFVLSPLARHTATEGDSDWEGSWISPSPFRNKETGV